MIHAERAMINQVQVIAAMLLMLLIAGSVKLGNDISMKCPVSAPGSPRFAELPRVEVLAHRRAARAHDNGR
jgi:hypothetical protein